MIPRRAAAILAEELTRSELAKARAAGAEDDEEEDDELYVEPANFQEEKEIGRHETRSHRISFAAQTAADVAFQELARDTRRADRLLADLVRVPVVPGSAQRVDFSKRPKIADDPMMHKLLKTDSSVDASRETLLELARETARTIGEVRVEETVRFGGQTTTLTSFVEKSSEATAAQQTQHRPVSGLDAMLEGISKKRGITTVEKSSSDWQSFKREKKLDEELKDAAKTGFVEKESFLARVDHRTFELERAAREHERMKRDLLAAQAKQ